MTEEDEEEKAKASEKDASQVEGEEVTHPEADGEKDLTPGDVADGERDTKEGSGRLGWAPWVVFGGCLLGTFVLGMLTISIMERRWETYRPQVAVVAIGQWETDNAVWGRNYPREYESYLKTGIKGTRTAFGGSYQRDYLEEDPRQVVLFAGYSFSRDYKQARGHYWAVEDITTTYRTTRADGSDTGQPGTCWTCKSSSVPMLMNEMGVSVFYNKSWKSLKQRVNTKLGCLDCHDPRTMNLRISRPALKEAFARQGKNIDKATHQQMRSLVCAQCHSEYYFANDPTRLSGKELTFDKKGSYLVFPWDDGTTVDDMERYYSKRKDFYDWIHPISRARMIKIQHPDWEIYSTGIHAYRDVSCADCHMPYKTSGGVKYTDHHVQSPLLNIAASCGVCHRWSEKEVKERVEAVQRKHYKLKLGSEDALVRAHFDVAACMEAGASKADLSRPRDLLWRAQLRWDYISAHNGMGFHSPQECVRILAECIDLAQTVRIEAARILARLGVSAAPLYPDIGSREKALDVVKAFEASFADPSVKPPSLLPPTASPAHVGKAATDPSGSTAR